MKGHNSTPHTPSPPQESLLVLPDRQSEAEARQLNIRIDVGSLVKIIYKDKPNEPKMIYFTEQEHLLSDLPDRVQKALADAALHLPRIDSPLGKALKGKTIGDEAHIVAKRRRDIEILDVEDLSQ